jgi:hypothetical protein
MMRQDLTRTLADLRPNAVIDCMVCEQKKPQAGSEKFHKLDVCRECASKLKAKQEKQK